MPAAHPNHGIVRIDLAGSATHGFQVRMQRRGVRYGKFFADRRHGGAAEALFAARVWRDELLRELELNEESARICRRSARNSSGVVGVSKVTVTTNGATYQFWQAMWSPEPGKRRCVKFSIKRYGDREAFDRAVQARREAVGE